MPSYPFLRMAAGTAKYYFRFRICWCHCFHKVKVYQQTKFRWDISIGGWDITTSGFEIQTSGISEFYFRFRSRPFRRNQRVILHLPIHALFWGVFWEYFPHMTSSIVQTPKGPSLGRNTSFEPFGVTIGATVRAGGTIEKRNSITKKVTRVLYFPYLGEAPAGPIQL